MFVSSIAASACLRKSLSLIWPSPRASRWALTIMRRYLETVTPGIATGYWKAMKTPSRDRSSGSASVMSSPSKRIEPPVSSSPLRISLSSALTCRSFISSVAISPSVPALGGACGRRPLRLVIVGERDQVRDGGPAERLRDAALDPGPEELRGAGLPRVDLVRAQHAPLVLHVEALHGRDRPLESLDDLEHVNLLGR